MRQDWGEIVKPLLWPAITLVVVLVVQRARHLTWGQDLGVRWPSVREISLWFGLFVVLVIVEELASRALGLPRAQPWGSKYTGLALILRLAGMIILAPVAEELVFRGLLFHVISQTPLGGIGAVFLTAVGFALIHGQYYGPELLQVLVDGLFFGFVRYATGSTLLTILCHSLGNLYAAYERVRG